MSQQLQFQSLQAAGNRTINPGGLNHDLQPVRRILQHNLSLLVVVVAVPSASRANKGFDVEPELNKDRRINSNRSRKADPLLVTALCVRTTVKPLPTIAKCEVKVRWKKNRQ